MSKFDVPDLPSDDELGLSKEEIEELEKELDDDGPEMTPEELEAFLGEPSPPPDPIPVPKKAPAAKRPKAEKGSVGPAPATEAEAPAGAEAAAPKAAKERKEPKEKKPRPKLEEEARTRWRGPVTLALLLAIAVFASNRTGLPAPVPANAPDTEFSSARAMAMLVEIAREAHPPGSPAHDRVRGYLVDRLTALGLEPEVQTTTALIDERTVSRFSPGVARAATVRNIVARLPGTASTGAVVATAHYDSREVARGAGDDGSGVVAILEALRAIRAEGPLQNDLIVLFTDAEELGLLGARAFVDEHPWMQDVRLVLSFEMRGGGGPAVMFETNVENGWVVRALSEADPRPAANSMSYEAYRRLPNDTDFSPFRDAGVQGLNFAAIDNAHVYHQEYDAPENLDEATLQDQGLNALGTMRFFGNANLETVDAPDVVYFTLPFVGMVIYETTWVLPITGGLVLLLLVGTALVARGGWGISGIVVGLGITVLAGVLAYGAAEALLGWLPRFHPELGALHGSAYHSEGWYVITLAAMAFTIVTAFHAFARRWYRMQELALGAAIIPLLAAGAASFQTPLAAMNLQLPVAAALLAIAIAGLLGARATSLVGWMVSLALAAFALVLLVPFTEFIWIAMSIRLGAGIALLSVVTLYLALPALDGLRHPNGWWAPLTGLVVAAGSLGIGILLSRPSEEHPAPSTLLYALDHDTGEALWATAPVDDTLDVFARQWAIERTEQAFGQEALLERFGYFNRPVPVAEAPVVVAEPPLVRVEDDTTIEGTRRAVISVRSVIGAELLRFSYPEGGRTRIVSINRKSLPDGLVRLEHWGTPDPVVVLELELPPEAPVELEIVEHLFRPEELLGADAFARPPHLAPNIDRRSDRAMFFYSTSAREGAAAEPSQPASLAADTTFADTTTAATTIADTTTADTMTAQTDTIGP